MEAEPVVGSLELSTTPEGSTISVDGEELDATTPFTLEELEPGEHTVTFAHRGYRNWEGTVTVEGGETASLTQELTAIRREPVAPPGRLSINTRPWSKVYVGR
ncbi:MAG: PEGA domain-containing protein, partial [Actinobacteria bacterium]|nr:PEGA domain-containing protein [Actinomycetota bacterium]